MKTNYLLPHRFKTFGWIIFILGILSGLLLFFTDYESDWLTVNVLSFYHEGIFPSDKSQFFKIIENSIVDELSAVCIIIGGLVVGFSKEKVEDEFIYKLRTDSLVWALFVNYSILLVGIVFIYDMTFFNVLIFNMFTPLVFFILRFNFLKYNSQSHDE